MYNRILIGKRFVSWPLVFAALSLQASDRIEKVFPVLKNSNLVLMNYSGIISIRGWQNSEIKAICVKHSQNVEIDTEFGGNKVRIATHVLDKLASPEKAKVDYQIFVPEDAGVQVQSNMGSVTIENIRGPVNVDVVDAPVRIVGTTGYVVAKSLGSKLEICQSRGIIQTNSVSGDIVFSKLESDNVMALSTLGNIFYEGDFNRGGKYSFSTNEGFIAINCPDQASVEWEAKTVKGAIESDLPIKSKSHRSVPRNSLERQSLVGVSNSGDATVQLTTFSGKIKIRRK
jgi:DUF4097 and DUF4098 domain-containing protein YvlB